jgi:AcrR family transcriptional regulator
MSEPVKRNYSSELRAGRARQTRRAVVSAAAALFESHGFAGTTAEGIATAAGVSRKTVFTVGSKTELLKLALDWAVTGDDEPVPLRERPEVDALRRIHDPAALVRSWAALTVVIGGRTAALSRALTVAAGIDTGARALWDDLQRQRLAGAREFAAGLANIGGLRIDADDAADLIWVHSDTALYHRLVIQRGWPPPKYETWLAATIAAQLCPPLRELR